MYYYKLDSLDRVPYHLLLTINRNGVIYTSSRKFIEEWDEIDEAEFEHIKAQVMDE